MLTYFLIVVWFVTRSGSFLYCSQEPKFGLGGAMLGFPSDTKPA